MNQVDQLYAQFARPLEQIVRGGVKASDAVVEDACQAAWARLVRHRHRITDAAARAWLTRTALHEACRLSRRQLRESPVELGREDSPLEGRAAPQPEELLEQRQRLACVDRLPRRQQRLIWLRALGLSYEEMACHEGCTSRTVERQLERAGQSLRRLEGDGPAHWAA